MVRGGVGSQNLIKIAAKETATIEIEIAIYGLCTIMNRNAEVSYFVF